VWVEKQKKTQLNETSSQGSLATTLNELNSHKMPLKENNHHN